MSRFYKTATAGWSTIQLSQHTRELQMKIWSGIVTEKVQESKAFYVRLFGCKVLYEADWIVLLELNGSELGFMKPNLDFQAPIFRAPFQGHGVWLVVDVDDAAAELQRIEALGVPIQVSLRDEPWGDRHFCIVDPNGIGVDVVQRMT